MKIYCDQIYTLEGCVDKVLVIENGKIIAIKEKEANEMIDVDCTGYRIIPGIIDTHNHGTMGYGLMGNSVDKEKEVRGYLKGLASQGVTACFPTADHAYFKTISKIAKTTVDGAKIVGIHSEGPYLNRVGEKGIDTGHPDIDINYIQGMVDDADGLLKLVAIAPEIPGAKEAIRYLNSRGVRCAFAHSNMNFNEAFDSFNWGISIITHTANVMSGIHHRNMGGLGAALLNDHVYNELICDGLHVSNEMIEMMLRIKNNAFEKFMMISDNVPMAGAPVGRYELPGMFEVNIDEKGYCLSDTGRLCGSTMPVIKGIANLEQNLNIPMEKIIKMSSSNQAKVYAIPNKGYLAVGMDADLAVIDNEYNVVQTYSEGRKVFDIEKDRNLFNIEFMKKHNLN
ncbi:MAG: amidohydrolase family protein [Erysipelotrichaceae bacterium]|nr:amidohydrolase family protein [Erysipelotrichaceae bacterium]MDY5252936.1 amidohydrolase family protein [Erysipelotrichaceae bacterium]